MAEKDFIPREAAKAVLNERYKIRTHMHDLNSAAQLKSAELEIGDIPAADVRPVVLCRDCIYYYKDADGYEMCDNSEGYDHVTEDGFCAWAKKREES